MRTIFVLLVLFATMSAFAKNQTLTLKSFIVGGTQVVNGAYPFIASLQGSMGLHSCGASLIKKNWVLTAAHCLYRDYYYIYVGLTNLNEVALAENFVAAKVIWHPDYNGVTGDYDIGLIKLSGDSSQTPAEINKNEIDISIDENKHIDVIAAGWGVTSEGSGLTEKKLRQVTVPLVNNLVCKEANELGRGNNPHIERVADNMICAGLKTGGRDACKGDSGGPLFAKDTVTGKFKLIGVTSWGDGCARQGRYGVYAKVSAVAKWIEETIAANP